MINKNIDIGKLNSIFKKYKNDYNPIINEFTKIYVYELDNEIVAFLIFNIMYEKCEIVDIYVLDDYRRKGIANSLISEIEKDYNLENITLEVSCMNEFAINLYEKLGFKKAAIRKNYYNDCDGILMVKEIR